MRSPEAPNTTRLHGSACLNARGAPLPVMPCPPCGLSLAGWPRSDRLRSGQPVPLSARSIPPPGDGDHSLEFHQPTFVHCHDSLDMPSQFISIIATIKVRYGAAILNDARRLECPKHLSLTSSSAP